MFKSLSVESNSNNWTGFVSTNVNPPNSNQSEFQYGDLDSFTRKESSSYVDIPPSEINSTANLVSGFRAASPFGEGVTLDNFDGAKFVWEVEIDHQHSQIPVGSFIVYKKITLLTLFAICHSQTLPLKLIQQRPKALTVILHTYQILMQSI